MVIKRFRIDGNTVWSETGRINIHNYPSSDKTFSYITHIYVEDKFINNKLTRREVDGSPIYFHELNSQLAVLANIAGEAQSALAKIIPHQAGLSEFKK